MQFYIVRNSAYALFFKSYIKYIANFNNLCVVVFIVVEF